jgi:hypothetical protein
MPRSQCTFRQSDVTKAVRAVVAAGVGVARVEVDRNGKIVVIAGAPAHDDPDGGADRNEWDRP